MTGQSIPQHHPSPRELDVLLSTGEQVTIGLLAMALQAEGVKAKSYTGPQVRVLTDSRLASSFFRMTFGWTISAEPEFIMASLEFIVCTLCVSMLAFMVSHLRSCQRLAIPSQRSPA